MRLRFTSAALADLDAIHSFIETESAERADLLIARIKERCEGLMLFPKSGRARPEFGDDVRSFAVRPTVVFYRLRSGDSEVEVLRIIDGRRDLGTVFAEDV